MERSKIQPGINRKKRNKSVSLLELLIAIVLLSVLVLGLTSIDFFSRNHVISSDMRSRLQNEIYLALEHINRSVMRATGDNISYGILGPNVGPSPYHETFIEIRVDLNSPPTPTNYADDTWVGYARDLRGGHDGELFYCQDLVGTNYCGSGFEANRVIVASHIPHDGFRVTRLFGPDGATPVGLNVTLNARHNVSVATSLDNPEMTMVGVFYSRSITATN